MKNKIIQKILLQKQKKCLKSLKYLLDNENIKVYKTAKGIIKYHEPFLTKSLNNLVGIKRFYILDLNSRLDLLKKSKYMEYSKKEELLSFISADRLILEDLTDDFINTYSKINYNIKIVNKLSKYLDINYDKFMNSFYEVYAPSKVDMKKNLIL